MGALLKFPTREKGTVARIVKFNAGGRDIDINGGFLRIARIDGEKYRFLDNPEPVIEALRNSSTPPDLFTFMQGLSDTEPKYSYQMEWDNFAALPITSFEDWWGLVGKKTRNMVRSAEKKGVVLREVPFSDELVEGIWKIYNECPMRQGKPFHHYGEDLPTVHKISATFLDCSIFIGAFLDHELIGFAKLTVDETHTQAGLMHIISMMKHRDKAPTNALTSYAVRVCADRKIPYLVYSNFAYGRKERDSLSDFKEHNGFRRIDVPRYYVPLTRTGKVALLFRLHRRPSDLLPEPVLSRLRELRSWYHRTLRLRSESLNSSTQ